MTAIENRSNTQEKPITPRPEASHDMSWLSDEGKTALLEVIKRDFQAAWQEKGPTVPAFIGAEVTLVGYLYKVSLSHSTTALYPVYEVVKENKYTHIPETTYQAVDFNSFNTRAFLIDPSQFQRLS